MTNQTHRTFRTKTVRRDLSRQTDRRVLAKRLFPGQIISYLDTCQLHERRENSRRIRMDRRR